MIAGTLSYLKHSDVGEAVGSDAAPVDLDVFEPLDVRLRVRKHFALELHITAHHSRAVRRESSLEDRPVRRALCW